MIPSCLQVQLLVSESDVENYKQIKSDLDELRLLVEKSELWVYKSKSEGKKEKKKKEDGGDDKVEGAKGKEDVSVYNHNGIAYAVSRFPFLITKFSIFCGNFPFCTKNFHLFENPHCFHHIHSRLNSLWFIFFSV